MKKECYEDSLNVLKNLGSEFVVPVFTFTEEADQKVPWVGRGMLEQLYSKLDLFG
jgi:glutamate formiminotransferase